MGNNVIEFPISTRAIGQSAEKYRAAHEDSGRQASQRLATSKQRLSWEDRTSIARRLYDEIKASGIKPGRIVAAARLANGTKELNKLAMKAGKDPKNAQLIAYPDRYYDVIKALAKLTRQNLHLVADRITVGTAVHPTRASQLGDVEKTLRGLDLLAAEVDKELGLFDLFQRTFAKKNELQNRGDLRDWPFFDIFEERIPHSPKLADLKLTKKALKALGFGTLDPEKIDLSEVDSNLFDEESARFIQMLFDNHEEQMQFWEKFKTGFYSFWNTNQDGYAEGLEFEALAFLPHAYLGIFEFWPYLVEKDPAAVSEARIELIKEYMHVPTASLPSAGGADPVIYPDHRDFDWYQVGHTWLLLYPDRQLSTIVPVLLRTDGDVGSRMERVTIGTLIELQKGEYISELPISAYERLVEVVFEKASDGEGFALVNSWLKTGRNLQDNPYLQVARRTEQARAQRDTLFVTEADDDSE